MRALEQIEKEQMRTDIPDFRPGDTVKVHVKIKEGEKERLQIFEGTVIRSKFERIESGKFHGEKNFLWSRRGTDFPYPFPDH